ncbi:MAG: hypothetical protein ACKVS8_10500 [Phycisphaerales bacterium]
MAARTSVGVGIGATIALLGVSTLALFVLTLMFWSDLQNTKRDRQQFADDVKAFVAQGEMNSDGVRSLKAEAEAQRKTVVSYLQESSQTLAQKLSGSAKGGMKELIETVDKRLDGQPTNLLALMADKDTKIAQLTKAAADADAARQAALKDLENQSAVTKAQKDSFDGAVASMGQDVGKVKDDAETYRSDLEKARGDMTASVEAQKREGEDKEAGLNNKISKLNEELLVAQGKIRALTEKNKAAALRPTDEAALVDGGVINVDAASGMVFVDRGRKHRVVLGMRFEVFADASVIRPDAETGDYPRGKATIEITKVDDSTSIARVLSGQRGNPVIRGDVLANALYDPAKTYSFLVYGNFDINRDGLSSVEEQTDIRAQVREWGGTISETLSGDVDFLVLGARPTLPPTPPADAPVPVVQEFIRLKRVVQEYDRLVEQATATSIPVLNQNRLFTLTGRGSGN